MRCSRPDDPGDPPSCRGDVRVTTTNDADRTYATSELSRRGFLAGAGTVAVAFALDAARAPRAAAAASHQLRIDESAATDTLAWLVLTPGRIAVHSGKVELGTGIQTALTQIVVEE